MEIKEKLQQLHKGEDLLNVEIGNIDKEIKQLLQKKKKLAKSVSKNMKYRNLLTSKL